MTHPETPVDGWQARVHELVDPFYLKLMNTNARSIDADTLHALVTIGGTVSAAETVSLLRTAWRETVMGAWYSLFVHDADVVAPELLKALDNSYGSFTAPPLAVASSMLAGREALPALHRYIKRDLAGEEWGAAGFVAAAVEHLGGESTHPATEADTANFVALSKFGQSLTWT